MKRATVQYPEQRTNTSLRDRLMTEKRVWDMKQRLLKQKRQLLKKKASEISGV